MFCPKCGNELPDGAAFCGKCGTKMRTSPAGMAAQTHVGVSTGQGPKASNANPTASMPAAAWATLLIGVVVGILFFCPWVTIEEEYVQGSQFLYGLADSAGSFLGQSSDYSSYAFDPSYSIWQLLSYGNAIDAAGGNLASVLFPQSFWGIGIPFMAFLVFSLVVGFKKKGKGEGFLVFSLVLWLLYAITFAFLANKGAFSYSTDSSPVAMLCTVVCVAGLVAIACTRRARGAKLVVPDSSDVAEGGEK